MTRSPETVLFQHIPKTAGSTLRDALARLFDPSEIWVAEDPYDEIHQALISHISEGTGDDRSVGMDANQTYLDRFRELPAERIERINLLQGHFFFGFHEHLREPVRSLTMLRDPVDRVLSLYQHRVARQGATISLEEYVRTKRDPQYSNDQTKRLSGSRLKNGDIRWDPVTEETYERARANLEAGFVVGLQERFDESVVLWQHTLGRGPIAYRAANVAPQRPREEGLPRDLVDEIKRDNEFDIRLHAVAHSLLDKQIGSTGLDIDREIRLSKLRNKKQNLLGVTRDVKSRSKTKVRRLGRSLRRRLP